ncbi:ABC transporter substrate-binding protein, partial [Pseudomonas syringae]|uniref:ABC transporter substrate-binding protein n=1 Tax=Pseudomonas syringae TaxID=317 RepID=UPI001F43C529
MKARPMKMLTVAMLAACSLAAGVAEAAGVLTIGRREDGTTFDPIKSAQNIDNWVFSNVYDVLIRVDDKGTKLEPGLANSWWNGPGGLTYEVKMRPGKFSEGSELTASDAVVSLLRIRDNKGSLWSDSYKIIGKAVATDPHTLVITLKNPSASFLSQLALPNVSILSEKAMK